MARALWTLATLVTAYFLFAAAQAAPDPMAVFKALARALLTVLVAAAITRWLSWRREGVVAHLTERARRAPRRARILLALSVCAVGWLALEGGCLVLNRGRASEEIHSTTVSEVYHEPDEDLGHRLIAGASVRVQLTSRLDGSTVGGVQNIGADGLRVTTRPDGSDTDRPVMFLGCSFTYGEWLPDGATLPSLFNASWPGSRVANYACGGYGPNHALALLEAMPELEPGERGRPIGIYVFMGDHVRRSVGSLRIAMRYWGERAPYFAPTEDGGVARRGNFYDDRPLRTVAYHLLAKSEFGKSIHFEWPPACRPADLDLCARILQAAGRRFEQVTGSEDFFVVLYPGCPIASQVSARLERLGVFVLDQSRLFDPRADGMRLPDGHPTEEANRLLADRLARDLRQLLVRPTPAGARAR